MTLSRISIIDGKTWVYFLERDTPIVLEDNQSLEQRNEHNKTTTTLVDHNKGSSTVLAIIKAFK